MKLKGLVQSGLGEGQFFLSLPPYRQGFEQVLGFAPFAGTLNVRVAEKDVAQVERLRKNPALHVPGFKAEGREYFQLGLVRARILGEEGALVFPFFNHHPPGVLEFVAAKNMRKKFGLQDGEEVEVGIEE
ncbi:Riboflavin kinase [uncultured archaeon]|nr:Riboflavin kinase [uncultured archaeon]